MTREIMVGGLTDTNSALCMSDPAAGDKCREMDNRRPSSNVYVRVLRCQKAIVGEAISRRQS